MKNQKQIQHILSFVVTFLLVMFISIAGWSQKKADTTPIGKIGFILYDSVLVNVNSYSTQVKLNEAYQKQLKAEYEMKKLELETKLKEYGEKQATMNADQKQAKEQELQKMDGELQTFAREAQQKLAQKEQDLIAPLNDKIAKAIESVAAKYGYTHITDKKTFYYVSSAYDVTKLVVEEANKL